MGGHKIPSFSFYFTAFYVCGRPRTIGILFDDAKAKLVRFAHYSPRFNGYGNLEVSDSKLKIEGLLGNG